MGSSRFEVGTFVTHPNRPEWGPGKVLYASREITVVYFRDAPEKAAGDAVKRIANSAIQLLPAPIQSDPWLDMLPPYAEGRPFLPERRVTREEGVRSFLTWFTGFADPKYHNQERDYKWNSHLCFLERFGHDRGPTLVREGRAPELIQGLRSIEQPLNLLSTFEKAAFADAMKHEEPAFRFAQALFALLDAPGRDTEKIVAYFNAVSNLPAEPGRAKVASWPVATLFPFLADPVRFAFLKPDVTKKAAERHAFELHYDPRPNLQTYSRTLTFFDLLFDELRPLGARDFIDVQSYVWVIGHYGSGKPAAMPS